jgi:hypothetical protein
MTRLPLLLLLAAFHAAGAAASSLYQIEVVVFARDSADAEVEEHWDRDHGLRYPGRLIGLIPEGAAPPTAQAAADGADPAASGAPPLPDGTVPAPTDATADTTAGPLPFQLLPASAQRLQPQARAIDRRSNLRVLFHGAWVQPAGALGSADPVLITGGRQFGRHHELEGYLTLTVDRYLHLDANLWMTRFTTASGLQAEGPVLPEPVITGGAVPEPDEQAGALPTTLTVDGFAPAQIYVMDQERRMRNAETHYLDHPRFGLLVNVIPYKAAAAAAPEPAQPAAPPATVTPG